MSAMTETKIRFIVHCYYSKMDLNGNCYWMAHVTSTKTGKTLKFTTPHASNALGQIRELGIEWENIHNSGESMLMIRDFNRMEKFVDLHDACKDPEVREAILALEKE